MKGRRRAGDTSTWLAVGAAVVAGLALGGWGVWRVMLLIPANTARLWALVGTALVPVVGYGCWRLGQLEARGRLVGFDQAVARVGTALARSRGAAKGGEPAPAVRLPEVEIAHRGNEGRGDVIEL
jgi:hypothetical protein